MKSSTKGICLLLTIAGTLAMVGCGSRPAGQPDLGRVSGVVTMDGAPLAGVEVSFAPDQGRASQGITDSEGKYELTYIGKTKGAKIGNHKVHVTTPVPGGDDSDPQAANFKETIPAKYNKSTTLTAEVKSGKNTFDFPLESK